MFIFIWHTIFFAKNKEKNENLTQKIDIKKRIKNSPRDFLFCTRTHEHTNTQNPPIVASVICCCYCCCCWMICKVKTKWKKLIVCKKNKNKTYYLPIWISFRSPRKLPPRVILMGKSQVIRVPLRPIHSHRKATLMENK